MIFISIYNFAQILYPTCWNFCVVGDPTGQAITWPVKQLLYQSAQFFCFWNFLVKKNFIIFFNFCIEFCAKFYLAHWSKFNFKIRCRGPLIKHMFRLQHQKFSLRLLWLQRLLYIMNKHEAYFSWQKQPISPCFAIFHTLFAKSDFAL